MNTLAQIADVADELRWLLQSELKLPRGLSTVIEKFVSISVSVRIALQATSSYNRLTSLTRASAEIDDLRRTLVFTQRPLNLTFAIAAEQWRAFVGDEIARITEGHDLWTEIPDPYVIGNPILPGSHHVFVGRDDIFGAIKTNLEKPFQKATLTLHGERRSGKTSVLLQLPSRLDTRFVPVFVDLQGLANVTNEGAFLYGLAKATVRCAASARGLSLPPPVRIEFEFDPYLAFNEWLDQVEAKLEGRLVVLCLDEFEKLAEQIREGKFSLRLLDLLRNMIQFRPSLVIIISGVQVHEYAQSDWASYFINTITLEVDVLKELEARSLITNPILDFPLDYEPSAVDRILAVTHCQPFLIQLICHEVVKQQNQLCSGKASLASAESALRSSLTSGDFYFRDRWNGLSDLDQKIATLIAGKQQTIHGLANSMPEDKSVIIDAINGLIRRKILRLDEENEKLAFSVELFGYWVASAHQISSNLVASVYTS